MVQSITDRLDTQFKPPGIQVGQWHAAISSEGRVLLYKVLYEDTSSQGPATNPFVNHLDRKDTPFVHL